MNGNAAPLKEEKTVFVMDDESVFLLTRRLLNIKFHAVSVKAD